jgi:hypothetical protein
MNKLMIVLKIISWLKVKTNTFFGSIKFVITKCYCTLLRKMAMLNYEQKLSKDTKCINYQIVIIYKRL